MRRNDWLLSQLPMGMLDDDFFVRFVSLFEDVATSYLEGADNIPNVVDVDVAPPELVRWLGSWIGMPPIDSSLAEDLQRRLVSTASAILAWRGTRQGLEQFLTVVTGGPIEVEESGRHRPRRAPRATGRRSCACGSTSIGWLSDEEFLALVQRRDPGQRHLRAVRRGAPAVADGGGGPVTIDITCPTCGTLSYFDELTRDAHSFCRVCDYPLFWVRSTKFSAVRERRRHRAAAAARHGRAGGGGHDRLPRLHGAQPRGPAHLHPVRGGPPSPTATRPRPPPPPPPTPVYVRPPEAPAPTRRWWPWVALAALAVAGIIVLVVLLID